LYPKLELAYELPPDLRPNYERASWDRSHNENHITAAFILIGLRTGSFIMPSCPSDRSVSRS